jgi:hypothetical protein
MKELMRDNIKVYHRMEGYIENNIKMYRRMEGYMENNMKVIVERKNMEDNIQVVSSSSE